MDVVDFFCGAGGFSEGFHQAGFNIVRAYDIWEPAIRTHNMNHPSNEQIARYGNVYDISMLEDEEFEKAVPDVDVIIGSPPCVAFSNSNNSGKADKTLGIKLIESYLRIVARKLFKENTKLKYWVFENVKNVEKYVKSSYTMQELGLEGDDILIVKNESSKVYNVKYFGVPSNRQRYICGFFPEPELKLEENQVRTLKTVMNSLGHPYEKIDKYVADPNYDFKLRGHLLTDHHYIKEIPEFEWEKARRQKQDKGYMGRMSFPENIDKPGRTVMATMSASSRESMIFPYKKNKYRYPTIREVATIMSFPIDYRFYGESDSVKYKLVGNAVPPMFSNAIAKAIIKNSNCKFNDNFKRKIFNKEFQFVNLNNQRFEVKVEKEKTLKTKYKYHVPYLIVNAFRVELLNKVEENKVIWKAEIHKSQGKNARMYKNFNYDKNFLSNEDLMTINNFIEFSIKKIGSFSGLQRNLCLTSTRRLEESILGPDELLQKIRELIDKEFTSYDDDIFVDSLDLFLPKKILISYYVLSKILGGIKNG